MTPTPIAIHGAAGRMGLELIRALAARRDAELVAALVRPGSKYDDESLSSVLGASAPPIDFSAALSPDVEPRVLIDFTHASSLDAALALAIERRIAIVSGTTGLSPAQRNALMDAGTRIPVLWASNFSLGVALLKQLAAQAAATLGDEFDVEIIETHHRAKEDAPSGTALTLGRAVADARRQALEDVARYTRHGHIGPRSMGEIGFSVIRAADVVGEHTVLFAAPGERLELTHRAGERFIFAGGAIRAALWLANKEPGFYDIADVLS